MVAAIRALVLAAATGGAAALPPLGSTVGLVTPGEIETPSPTWPGSTAAQSNVAFPGGLQPPRLRYWPQLNYGLANRTLLGCWKVQVLHDTNHGWPGVCVNLARNTEVSSTEAACRTFCEQEPRCAVWQFNIQTQPGQCWVGFGTHCANREGRSQDIVVGASQRIMHGDVHVLRDLRGLRVNNLFDLGKYDAGDDVVGVDRCKAWCYSVVGCQYWLYSVSGGCFVDAPMFSTERNSKPGVVVQYPLTTNGGVVPDSTVLAGEFLAHYCPPIPASTTPAPPLLEFPHPSVPGKPSSGGGFFTLWILAGFALLAAAGGAYWYMSKQEAGGEGSKGSKRGSKRNMYAQKSGYAEYEDEQPGRGGQYYSEDKPLMNSAPQTPDQFARHAAGAAPNPYGPPATAFNQQMPPTTYGPGPGAGRGMGSNPPGRGAPGGMTAAMPPPTQLVDFGQAPGVSSGRAGPSSMAPTQLLNQGLPFPSPGQPYPQQGGRGPGY